MRNLPMFIFYCHILTITQIDWIKVIKKMTNERLIGKRLVSPERFNRYKCHQIDKDVIIIYELYFFALVISK